MAAPALHAEHILANFNHKLQLTSTVEQHLVPSAFFTITHPDTEPIFLH